MGAVKHLLQDAIESGMDQEEAEAHVTAILYPEGQSFVGPIERLRTLQKRAQRPCKESNSVRGRKRLQSSQ